MENVRRILKNHLIASETFWNIPPMSSGKWILVRWSKNLRKSHQFGCYFFSGDRIVSVNGVGCDDLDYSEVIDQLRSIPRDIEMRVLVDHLQLWQLATLLNIATVTIILPMKGTTSQRSRHFVFNPPICLFFTFFCYFSPNDRRQSWSFSLWAILLFC